MIGIQPVLCYDLTACSFRIVAHIMYIDSLKIGLLSNEIKNKVQVLNSSFDAAVHVDKAVEIK